MNRSHLKIWAIATMLIGITTVIIRAIWQIVVIPTTGTMLIFLPIIVAMLGLGSLFAYLILNPDKMKNLPFIIGVSVVLIAGLIAGTFHYANFIDSPNAEHPLSKAIASLILFGCVNGFAIVMAIMWSNRKVKENG